MADVAIKFDKSKHHGECRGDRTTDDPTYRVHFWQGGLLGKDTVVLPFDAHGNLVSDDGKNEPWMGTDTEGKPVKYHPLWTPKMREYLALKQKRANGIATDDDEVPAPRANMDTVSEDVNLAAWLRGEARYEWALLVTACKNRCGRMYTSKREMVTELVIDEKVVPEAEVCDALKGLLPA